MSEFSHDELVEFFEYLDGLRSSGATNMFGARPYIQAAFSLSEKDSRRVLTAWMETFKNDAPVEIRVDEYLAGVR